MKNLFILVCIVMTCASAANAEIQLVEVQPLPKGPYLVNSRLHKIYRLNNNTNEKVTINVAKKSCGACTKLDIYPKDIFPGQSAKITMWVDIPGRPGQFKYSAVLSINGETYDQILEIKGKSYQPIDLSPDMMEFSFPFNSNSEIVQSFSIKNMLNEKVTINIESGKIVFPKINKIDIEPNESSIVEVTCLLPEQFGKLVDTLRIIVKYTEQYSIDLPIKIERESLYKIYPPILNLGILNDEQTLDQKIRLESCENKKIETVELSNLSENVFNYSIAEKAINMSVAEIKISAKRNLPSRKEEKYFTDKLVFNINGIKVNLSVFGINKINEKVQYFSQSSALELFRQIKTDGLSKALEKMETNGAENLYLNGSNFRKVNTDDINKLQFAIDVSLSEENVDSSILLSAARDIQKNAYHIELNKKKGNQYSANSWSIPCDLKKQQCIYADGSILNDDNPTYIAGDKMLGRSPFIETCPIGGSGIAIYIHIDNDIDAGSALMIFHDRSQ